MLLEGITASVSGLRAAARRVSQSAHNLANVSTPGFVPSRVELADALPSGVTVVGSSPMQTGPVVPTDGAFDLALDGPGFFILNDGQGGQVYTRAGNFMLDAQGNLVDPLGRTVAAGITVPANAASVSISPNGQVQALAEDGTVLAEGQIQIASFGNAGGLESIGGNAYRATLASGPAVTNVPGTPGHGSIVRGSLQASGTDIATEMVNLITGQRAFEANAKVIQTEDEMIGTVVDIKS